MAKKKGKKAVTVRKVYIKAKKAGRKVRRYAGESVSKKDIILGVAGAAAGGIGGAMVLQKIPEAVPPMVSNAALALGGGFLAYKGIRKRNKLLLGLGLGMGAVGARGIVGNFVPTLAGEEAELLTYNSEPMSAPFGSSFAGPVDSFAAPVDGDLI